MILRRPTQDSSREEEAKEEQQAWKETRRRLQLAEAGMWTQLAQEAHEDIARMQRDREAGRFTVLQVMPEGAEERKRRSAAVNKVKHDCTRTAAQMLR
eukprot:12408972-Karenia_brevis.AAC.1